MQLESHGDHDITPAYKMSVFAKMQITGDIRKEHRNMSGFIGVLKNDFKIWLK